MIGHCPRPRPATIAIPPMRHNTRRKRRCAAGTHAHCRMQMSLVAGFLPMLLQSTVSAELPVEIRQVQSFDPPLRLLAVPALLPPLLTPPHTKGGGPVRQELCRPLLVSSGAGLGGHLLHPRAGSRCDPGGAIAFPLSSPSHRGRLTALFARRRRPSCSWSSRPSRIFAGCCARCSGT